MEYQSYGIVVPPIVTERDPSPYFLESGEKSPRLDFKSLVDKYGRAKVKEEILKAIKSYLFKCRNSLGSSKKTFFRKSHLM